VQKKETSCSEFSLRTFAVQLKELCQKETLMTIKHPSLKRVILTWKM